MTQSVQEKESDFDDYISSNKTEKTRIVQRMKYSNNWLQQRQIKMRKKKVYAEDKRDENCKQITFRKPGGINQPLNSTRPDRYRLKSLGDYSNLNEMALVPYNESNQSSPGGGRSMLPMIKQDVRSRHSMDYNELSSDISHQKYINVENKIQ